MGASEMLGEADEVVGKKKRIKQALIGIGSSLMFTLALGAAGASSVRSAKADADRARIVFESASRDRIDVEQRRYEEAVVEWRRVSEQPFGKLGVALGWAEAPPR